MDRTSRQLIGVCVGAVCCLAVVAIYQQTNQPIRSAAQFHTSTGNLEQSSAGTVSGGALIHPTKGTQPISTGNYEVLRDQATSQDVIKLRVQPATGPTVSITARVDSTSVPESVAELVTVESESSESVPDVFTNAKATMDHSADGTLEAVTLNMGPDGSETVKVDTVDNQ